MSDERSPGVAFLEELQSEAYANHEDWRCQLDVLRDEHNYVLTSMRMSERAALELATHHPPGMDVLAATKQILDAGKQPPARLELPTPFQNPNDYRILIGLRKRIDETSARTNVEIPPGVTFGTSPMGDVEARTFPVKASAEYVIVVREGVLSFIHVLGKVLLAAMETPGPDGSTNLTADVDTIVANVTGKPEIVQAFVELLDACFTDGNAWNAPRRYLPPSYVQPLQQLINSGELFVICHELAHIKLGHFSPDPARAALAAQQGMSEAFLCEFQADLVGQHDALAVMGANFGGFIRSAASGISLVLTGLDIYERARAHSANAEPSRPDPSHPSFRDRRAAIYAIWSGYDLGEDLRRGANVIDTALETIWSEFERTRPDPPRGPTPNM